LQYQSSEPRFSQDYKDCHDLGENNLDIPENLDKIKVQTRSNRYDVTILVNGLPLVHIEY
jgi:type I site-specific restriction-modification system R (restriction) subunit